MDLNFVLFAPYVVKAIKQILGEREGEKEREGYEDGHN